MSLSSRVAVASGAAACAGFFVVALGRLEASVVVLAILALGARAAASAALAGGTVSAAFAVRSLRRQAAFAPAWALIVATGAWRAASVEAEGLRGANAVAGLAIARGDALAVAGAWCALAAAVIAIAGAGLGRPSTAAPSGMRGVVWVPPAALRLERLAVAAQVSLAAVLFALPSVSTSRDAAPWLVAPLAIGAAVVLAARRVPVSIAPPLAAVLSAAALALALAGGRV